MSDDRAAEFIARTDSEWQMSGENSENATLMKSPEFSRNRREAANIAINPRLSNTEFIKTFGSDSVKICRLDSFEID